ncbi:cytochrome c oxidase subunit II [soil metagenome]
MPDLPAPFSPRRVGHLGRVGLLSVAAALASCDGEQSALAPAGREAEAIARLFWWMVGGAALVWAAVVGLLLLAAFRWPGRSFSHRKAKVLIFVGGAVVPTLALAVLLVYGLGMLPALVAPAPEGSLRVAVDGYQWWWRVRYPLPDGGHVELANEIRLPAGEPVRFDLESRDVIHAFWIPALGGKVDMIPGRKTQLTLHPTRTGTFRGICAEYCGSSHALMAISVQVMEPDAFRLWLERQAEPAQPPDTPEARGGLDVFLASGCGACHTVRGTEADGTVGPDLTHVGGRLSLGAGILPNDAGGFYQWLAYTGKVKPGVTMPHFGMLPEGELRFLSNYLEGLK